MEDQANGQPREKGISLDPTSPKDSNPTREQQRSQIEEDINEIMNDNTNFNSPSRKDEVVVEKK